MVHARWYRAGEPVGSKLSTLWNERGTFPLKMDARDWGASLVTACMQETLGPSPVSPERKKEKDAETTTL